MIRPHVVCCQKKYLSGCHTYPKNIVENFIFIPVVHIMVLLSSTTTLILLRYNKPDLMSKSKVVTVRAEERNRSQSHPKNFLSKGSNHRADVSLGLNPV
jgi:hypothetical protein